MAFASGGAKGNYGNMMKKTKNEDINGSNYEVTGEVDPKLLETNSPNNRRVIEEAYLTYANKNNSRGGGEGSNVLDTVEQLKGSSNY